MVAIRFRQKFNRTVALQVIKEDALLKDMLVARKGNRLSITPVEKSEFERIFELGV